MKLYLVRHGQSTGNVGGSLMGQSDHPLTELGEAQARAAAQRLAPLGPMPLHCSDLPRALATAEHVAAAWSGTGPPGATAPAGPVPNPSILPDPRLREIDLGDYEGRSWEEFEADTELISAFAVDPYGTALPGGESLAHLETRVLAALGDILAEQGVEPPRGGVTDASVSATGFFTPEPGAAACIVSHDGPIRALLNHYLGVPPQKWWTLSTTHGGVSLLEFAGGWVNVRYVNATSHLAGLGDTVYVPSDDG
jgi:broad specificity phosphatase PhoE